MRGIYKKAIKCLVIGNRRDQQNQNQLISNIKTNSRVIRDNLAFIKRNSRKLKMKIKQFKLRHKKEAKVMDRDERKDLIANVLD